MSEHLGRNITRQLEARPQLEDLAPCGSPHCNGCYDVGDGRKIHPPRNGEGRSEKGGKNKWATTR